MRERCCKFKYPHPPGVQKARICADLGKRWRRRRVPFAKLWRAAVASTVDARAELRALNIASIADLVKRGGCSVLSPAHTELAHEADHLLKLLDDALRARQRADEKAAARRRLQENN